MEEAQNFGMMEPIGSHLEGNSSVQEPYRPDRHRSGSRSYLISAAQPLRRSRRIQERRDYRIRSISEAEHEDAEQPVTDVEDRCLPNSPPPVSPSRREIRDNTKPTFVDFVCEWKGCSAVLHNLDRLKKHIGFVHGCEARRSLRCRWGTCGQSDEGDLATPVSFATIEELDKHVDIRHMRSVMWHLGDGQKGGPQLGVVPGSTNDPPQYLFYKEAQVSPWVKDQQIETVAENLRRVRRLKEFRANLHAE